MTSRSTRYWGIAGFTDIFFSVEVFATSFPKALGTRYSYSYFLWYCGVQNHPPSHKCQALGYVFSLALQCNPRWMRCNFGLKLQNTRKLSHMQTRFIVMQMSKVNRENWKVKYKFIFARRRLWHLSRYCLRFPTRRDYLDILLPMLNTALRTLPCEKRIYLFYFQISLLC